MGGAATMFQVLAVSVRSVGAAFSDSYGDGTSEKFSPTRVN
jgi:hypothetical protein